jgi:F-type H+-transporting ATPase subunit b
MVSVDGSVFIQIVNFLFLIWVLNIVLFRPIRKALSQRREKVDGMQQNIESLAKDAKEKDDAFSKGLREARAAGLKQKEALIAQAAEEEKRLIGEINAKAQAELVAAREKISREADGVRVKLEKELDAFAEAIGQKILGRAV